MSLRPLFILFCLALVALSATAAHAQKSEDEPKIDPDRNDFTLGTSVVPRGHVQLETGATISRRGDERQNMLGETTLRVPVSGRAEVRFDLPDYLIQRQLGRQAGLEDGGLEARFLLSKTDKNSSAITLFSIVPSGSKRVAERRYQPGAVLALQHDLSDKTTLVFNLGAQSATSDKKRFTQLIAASEIQANLSKNLDAFTELYLQSRDEKDSPTQKFIASGVVYFLGNRTALDARFGLGLGNKVGGPSYLYSAGVSRLF